MPFTLERVSTLRSYSFHATRIENVPNIRIHRLLLSASCTTSDFTQREDDGRLGQHLDSDVRLGDQMPLKKACVDLQDGWSWQRFLRELNDHVYFFPSAGPSIPKSCEAFVSARKNRHIQMAVLRVPTVELFAANPDPRFCRYNSGAPRMVGGRPSPRGPQTFSSCKIASFRAGDVREIVFRREAVIPSQSNLWLGEEWEPL